MNPLTIAYAARPIEYANETVGDITGIGIVFGIAVLALAIWRPLYALAGFAGMGVLAIAYQLGMFWPALIVLGVGAWWYLRD